MPVKRTRNNSLYGFPNPTSNQFPAPIVTNRAPTSYDQGEIGQEWINNLTNSAWILTSIGNWESVTGGSGDFSTLTVSGATNLSLDSGIPGYQVASDPVAGTLTLQSTNLLTVQSTSGTLDLIGQNNAVLSAITGTISIGTGGGTVLIDSGTGATNIGTTAFARIITLGNITGATAVNINTGTAGSTVTTTNGVFAVATGTGAINLGTDAVAKTITLGNVTGATAVNINGGTGGVNLASGGQIAIAPVASTVASPTASLTSNVRVISATFTGFTTAMSASQAFTITSSKILATSAIMATVTNLNVSTNGAIMTLVGVTQAAGSIVVHTTNNGGAALGSGDNVLVNVWILS